MTTTLTQFPVIGYWAGMSANITSVVYAQVTFTPRLHPSVPLNIPALQTAIGTYNTSLLLQPVQAIIRYGQLQTTGGGTVQLLANSLPVATALAAQGISSLIYDVTFASVQYTGKNVVALQNFAFTASPDTTQIDLSDPNLVRLAFGGTAPAFSLPPNVTPFGAALVSAADQNAVQTLLGIAGLTTPIQLSQLSSSVQTTLGLANTALQPGAIADNSDGTLIANSITALEPLTTIVIRSDNTAPAIGQITYYNATTGNRTPTLPALSGLRVGARLAVRRDPADTSTNTVTVSLTLGDTFYSSGTTSFTLPLSGEQREFQVISIASVKYWAPTGSLTPVSSLVPWVTNTPGTLPATVGQPLKTQGGNILDDSAGNATIKSILSPASVAANSTGAWLNQSQTITGSASSTTASANYLNIADKVVYSGTNSFVGLSLIDFVTSPATGGRVGIWGQTIVNSVGTLTANTDYVGVAGRATTAASLGGVSGTPIGSFWGAWFTCGTTGGAYHTSVMGVEIDVQSMSSWIRQKIGARIVLGTGDVANDTVRGALDDVALQVVQNSGAMSWAHGIKFGTDQWPDATLTSGAWPFNNTSTIIGTSLVGNGLPANIGIDFSNITFTGKAIDVGKGAISAGSLMSSSPISFNGAGGTPWLNQSINVNGTLNNHVGAAINSLAFNDSIVGSDNYITGLTVYDNVQSPAVGPRLAIQGEVHVSGVGTSTITQCQYVGILGRADTGVNLGGTPTSAIGEFWGGWFQGTTSGGTHHYSVFGVEVDLSVQSDVQLKVGLRVQTTSTDTTQGTTDDAAIQVFHGSGSVRWLNGLMFGSNQANVYGGSNPSGISQAWPFDSTSTMIGTSVVGSGLPANIGIDFSQVTFNDCAIKTGPAPIQMGAMASAPVTPASGKGKLYVASDGSLHYVGASGTDTRLAVA